MPPKISTTIEPVAETSGLPGSGSPKPVDKLSEAIAGGSWYGMSSVADTVQILSKSHDEAQRRYGDRVFEVMMRDAIAGGSVDVLKHAALSSEIRIVPRVQPRPGKPPTDPSDIDLIARAAEAAELCQWAMDRLDTPIHQTLFELLDAMPFGSALAEIVWEIVPNGRFAGMIVPKAIKPKARTAWMFAVDPFFNVKGIVASTPGVGGWEVLPREKFFALTWGGRGGDPRGTPILNRATEPWNFRVQLPREHFKFCQRFGSPAPVGTLAENQAYDTDNGVELSPEQHFLNQILQWANGRGMVKPFGSLLELLEPKSKGEVFGLAFEHCRREIILAVLLQARVTMEATNGSKADSETSENVLGNVIRYIRRWLARGLEWDIFYKIILYNYGKDVADEVTPQVDSGSVEHQDLASLLMALGKVGYKLDASQLPEIDASAGLPVRESPAETGTDLVVEDEEDESDPKEKADDPAATTKS